MSEKDMSVRQARNEVIDVGGFSDAETLAYVDNLISAVRRVTDTRWQTAIAAEINYQKYARSAIGESAAQALENVLNRMKEANK